MAAKKTPTTKPMSDVELARQTAAAAGVPLAPSTGTGAIGATPDFKAILAAAVGTAGSAEETDDPIDALLSTVGLKGLADQSVDVTGVGAFEPIGPGGVVRGSRKLLTVGQAVTELDRLSAAEIKKLQTTLYEAGFYPNAYYQPGASAPRGDRYSDGDFLGAYADAIKRSFQARGTGEKFSDILAKNVEDKRPVFVEKAKEEADYAESKARSARNQAEADANKREAEAKRAEAAALAARTPTRTTPTRTLELPSMASLAGDINTKAQALLGRDATDAERQMIGAMVRDQLKARGLQSADVAQFNDNLSEPVPSVAPGIGTVSNPQPTGTGALSAPASQYAIRTDGSSDARTAGFDQGFGGALSAFQRDAQAAGFDIVVGSGHRTKAEQTALFNKSDKSGKMVGSPDGSKHVSGEAGDLRAMVKGKAVSLGSTGTEAATKWAHDNAGKYGLTFPLSYEKWHIEPITARNKNAVMPALDGAKAVGAAGVQGAVDIGSMLDSLEQLESGGQNIETRAKGSSASGYYQITDPTWGKYKGYARAIDAPREVQREKAKAIMEANLQKFGTPDLALAAYFAGAGNSKAKLQALINEDRSPTAGTQTANMGVGSYVRRILGGAKPTTSMPTVVGTGSVADIKASAPYAGAVTTANGANVLVSDAVDPAQTIEDELKRRNPVDREVFAQTKFYDVYRRLAGGR